MIQLIELTIFQILRLQFFTPILLKFDGEKNLIGQIPMLVDIHHPHKIVAAIVGIFLLCDYQTVEQM